MKVGIGVLVGSCILAGVNRGSGTENDGKEKGLVGYWKFDESGWNGTKNEVKDISGHGNHGTAHGDATTVAEGKLGRAGTFDGDGDYLDCGNDESLNITGPITIELWLKAKSWGSGNGDYFVSKAQSNQGYVLEQDAGSVRFRLFEKGVLAGQATFPNPSLNAWHHVVGTYDGTNLRLYLDGVLKDTSGTVPPITGTGGNLYISWWFGAYGFFNGLIDEVKIYNYALTEEMVRWANLPLQLN